MTTSPAGKPSVAFVGLGKMGAAMAANLQKAGYPLTVWNRSADKAAPLVAGGARLAASPAEAAGAADIVISSLADDASFTAVVDGPDGVAVGLRSGAIHVGTSTVSPELSDDLARRHAAQNAHYLAGPVLGRVPAAVAAQLVTFVAGEAEAIETARPVITTYAPMMLVVGDRHGQASIAKLIANFLGVSAIDLIGQSIAWAEKSDLPPGLLPQLLASFFGNPATRDYVTKVVARDFDDAGFTAAGGLKDVGLMIAAATAAGQRLTSAEAVRAKLQAALARGWREKDWSCFTEIDRA
jgi:3-hydroxyisobutyrate dehydrogenase-like beta-hydroxyacid dehydrogenase